VQLTSTTTGINDKVEKTIPTYVHLEQNYPNPFNPETTISYELSEPSHARLVIRNVLGQEINKLIDRHQAAGRYSVRWNGRDFVGNKVASGVYFYTLEANNSAFTKTLILLQ
jgi:flagellar hook assembly protein FlgD